MKKILRFTNFMLIIIGFTISINTIMNWDPLYDVEWIGITIGFWSLMMFIYLFYLMSKLPSS